MIVTCDGACYPNPGHMAVGFVVRADDGALLLEHGEHIGVGTNNVAEISAVAIALETIEPARGLTVRSDSQYVINCATGMWARKKNRDAWERFDKALRRHRRVTFKWVRGHDGDPDNERADKLAGAALSLAAAASHGSALLFESDLQERWGEP